MQCDEKLIRDCLRDVVGSISVEELMRNQVLGEKAQYLLFLLNQNSN